MYKCINGHTFDEPAERGEDNGGYYTEINWFAGIETRAVCPVCGSDEMTELCECDFCGQHFDKDSLSLTDELKYICSECADFYERRRNYD